MKKKHNYFFPEIIQISVEFLGSDYRSFKIGMPQEKNKIRQLDYDHYSNDTVSWRKQSWLIRSEDMVFSSGSPVQYHCSRCHILRIEIRI